MKPFRHPVLRLTVVPVTFAALMGCSTSHKTDDTASASVAQNAAAGESASREPSGVISSYPLLERLEASGIALNSETRKWMDRWRGMDLEDESTYRFPELSGSTSVNLKVEKADPSDAKGWKGWGSFVPRNGAANPNTEVAAFHLAAILGYDALYRPAARYELGRGASAKFKALIQRTPIRGTHRIQNRDNILREIDAGRPLRGCVKAKKADGDLAIETLGTGSPKMSHPVIAAIQASNPKPRAGETVQLARNYTGDTLELAKQFSVMMMIDTVTQQWDRWSGGNVLIQKSKEGRVAFYGSDNGGAGLGPQPNWVEKNLSWFSRYDRQAVRKLEELNEFLKNPSRGFIGYTNAEQFVVDLGLTTEATPAQYVQRLSRNIGLLLDRVRANESRFGAAAYFD